MTKNHINTPWNSARKNTKKHKNNKYEYLFGQEARGIVGYFDADTMEPLCWIPDQYTAWTAIMFVAFTVHRLTAEGKSVAQVRSEAELLARDLRSKHLRDKAYIKTIKGQLSQAITLEAADENSWATDYVIFEQDGRRIMARLLPHPRKVG